MQEVELRQCKGPTDVQTNVQLDQYFLKGTLIKRQSCRAGSKTHVSRRHQWMKDRVRTFELRVFFSGESKPKCIQTRDSKCIYL
jgi:hypothetical protein